MAFTSDLKNAQSDDLPFLKLTVGNREGTVAFPDHKGVNDMTKNKGDLWKFDISDFELDTCIRKRAQIDNVTIVNGGNDGWNIASVVSTLVRPGKKNYTLSADTDVDRWIDGNGDASRWEYDLTLIK